MHPQERANDLFNRALGYFRQERLSEANELLDPLLAIAPDAPPALNLKAVILSRLGFASQALPYAVQAVTFSPEDPVYCCNLGQVLTGLGHVNEAISAFELGFKLFLKQRGHAADTGEMLLNLAQVATIAPQALTEPSVYFENYLKLLHARPQAALLRSSLLEQLHSRNVITNSSNEATAHAAIRYLMDLVGLSLNTPATDNRTTVETLVLPWLQQALEREWFDLALWLELQLDLRYVHQTETEEHYARHYRTVAPLMNGAGRQLRNRLPPTPSPANPNTASVAFVVHHLDSLGPNRVLLDALRSMDQTSRAVSVYVLSDVDQRALSSFLDTGVRIVALSDECPHLRGMAYQLLLELRRRLANDGTAAILWATNIAHMSFAFGLRLAPAQIWWSMKYHSVELEDIDGYFALGTLEKFKRIGSRNWRCVHGAVGDLYDADLNNQARKIRQQFPVKTLLGCMGRVEKLDNPQYLDAVADILQARPDTGFLWSGQSRLPRIQECFERAGVADRCFFVGWIDTRLYAQVLDVCLDTFPFGGGITVFECMAAGKPTVFHLSPEAMESGVPMVILPLLNGQVGTPDKRERAQHIYTAENGETLFLCATNNQEYTKMALRLIDDKPFRDAVGHAGQEFVEAFVMDIAEMARTLLVHIEEITTSKMSALPHG